MSDWIFMPLRYPSGRIKDIISHQRAINAWFREQGIEEVMSYPDGYEFKNKRDAVLYGLRWA